MYQLFIQIIKYGFSTILFGVGVYVLVSTYRDHRTMRALFRGFAVTAYFLFAAGLTLFLFTGEAAEQLTMFFIKAISTAFGLLYGIYATLNGFMETDKETGKKTVTRLGVLGIFILSFNTVLLVSMDYLQETAAMEEKLREKQDQLDQERQRKQDYEKLLGSVSFVDRKTGDLKIDFEKFSENLYRSLVSVEGDLRTTRTELAARETELKDAQARVVSLEAGLKQASESLTRTEKNLSSREAELKEAQSRLAESDGNLKTVREELARSEKVLSAREAELKSTQDQLAAAVRDEKKSEEELSRTAKALAAKEAEASEQTRRAVAAEAAAGKLQEELKRISASLAGKEAEARELAKNNASLSAALMKETEEHNRLDRLLAAREAELKACRVPPAPVPQTPAVTPQPPG